MTAYVRTWWRHFLCRCGHLRWDHHDPADKRTPDWCLYGDCSLYQPVDTQDTPQPVQLPS